MFSTAQCEKRLLIPTATTREASRIEEMESFDGDSHMTAASLASSTGERGHHSTVRQWKLLVRSIPVIGFYDYISSRGAGGMCGDGRRVDVWAHREKKDFRHRMAIQ